MAIDFPVATTVGQTYTDPVSGSTFVVTVVGPPAQWVGSGSSTNLDATYLRKDASNDPVTGTLTVTPSTNVEGLVVTQGATQTATALRITNEGSGNALIVEDSANPDSTPVAIDSSGRLLVGTSSYINTWTNSQKLVLAGGATTGIGIASAGGTSIVSMTRSSGTDPAAFGLVDDGDVLGILTWSGGDGLTSIPAARIQVAVDGTPGANDMPGRLVFSTTADGDSSSTERMRIDSSGRVGIGTVTSPEIGLRIIQDANGADLRVVTANWTATTGTITNLTNYFASRSTAGATITNLYGFAADNNLTSATNNYAFYSDLPSGTGHWNFYANGAAPNYFAGDVRVGSSFGVNITSGTSSGNWLIDGGVAYHVANQLAALYVGRNTNDGNLVAFYQAGTAEGSISVAGSTVSYNPFLGSHWGRLADGSKPDILPGTILDTVDQLIEWKLAKFTVDGEEKTAAYNGPAEVGDTVEIDYEGISYSAIVQNEEEEPEELNKHVCVKVNDTASSKAVFGVFLGWDNDIPDYMVSTWNDLYCAAVGNYFVRIADGETLEIGSLIEADGNGCGIVQDDDIIRSKTVAKITSTIPQKVYDDGSFLVTCVLCCG